MRVMMGRATLRGRDHIAKIRRLARRGFTQRLLRAFIAEQGQFCVFVLAMRVALLLVALVAAAHATCLADKLGVYFSNSGTGSLSGVNPTTVQNLPSLPICASAYTKTADGFSTCCNVDGFNAIKTFGDNIAASIDQIIATGESLKNVFANIDTTKIPDQYKEAFNTFKSVFGDFLKNFFGNYGTCVRAYADYYEGVLCSLCRPDFFPTVANITDAGVLQFRFDLGTCTSIVNKCTPAVQDLYTFVTKLAAAYALLTPNLGSLVPGVTVPSTNVDLDFLAGIAGSTTAEKIRIWLCNQRMAGISQIDLVYALLELVSAR